MARRRFAPNVCNSQSVNKTLLLLAACFALLPALAAKPLATIDETAAAMEVNDSAPDRFLTPQAEAAIRNAFRDEIEVATERRRAGLADATPMPTPIPVVEKNARTDADEAVSNDSKKATGMNTRLPGISDEDTVRYKKQMFRRDI